MFGVAPRDNDVTGRGQRRGGHCRPLNTHSITHYILQQKPSNIYGMLCTKYANVLNAYAM
jgi:hypothetical protein